MKIVYALAVASFTIIALSAWKYLNLSTNEWTTEELTKFASFMYTILSGFSIAGAGFAFAYELNHRRNERAFQKTERNLSDLRSSMVETDQELEKILKTKHESNNGKFLNFEVFLHPINSEGDRDLIPEFKDTEMLSIPEAELMVSSGRAAKLLNTLREACIVYDKASQTNVKSELYRGRYYYLVKTLERKGYPLQPWKYGGWHEQA